MTGLFVAAGILVQVVEFGVAGAFLGAYRDDSESKRLIWLAFVAAFLAAVAGIVLQNILGT
jgi:cytochrome b subunit of formate dehydrogenase